MEFYAHTIPGAPESDWEPLERHLENVSRLAATFCSPFASSDWGSLAGLWHDIGKYHPQFQARLNDPDISQPHAGAGAALSFEKDPRLGLLLAWVIAGHHVGLANRTASGEGFPKPLMRRIEEARTSELAGARPHIPPPLVSKTIPRLPTILTAANLPPRDLPLRVECWVRFLFSALVDADRLATEAFCSPDKSDLRKATYDDIAVLGKRLEACLAEMESGLTAEQRARPINVARHEISEACRGASEWAPGLFSLTVPTGGGKTLAAMRFALSHAERYRLERVIVVIPFTNIIEQNAARYAEVLGAQNIIEHHSNLDPEKHRKDLGERVTSQHELAAENWDAPVIVTTTVQFFESLFSNNPSRCRKLHNIARSVIILDEVQSLPAQFLIAILDMLKQLTTVYGCSIVLSTATPPALRRRESLPQGLEGVREIVSDPSGLAEQLRRVRYEWPDPDAPAREWPDVAEEAAVHRQVLVVVHRRADARELAEELQRQTADPESIFHLSALMCPAHRTEVLEQVREALKDGGSCRLVSTQLIEAGVDVDFPLVFRALAGLDSVVQAAGRCNREGRADLGTVVVFKAPTKPPPGILGRGHDLAVGMLRGDAALDACDPSTQERYFRALYFGTDLDSRHIQRERRELNFATVARDFNMIEDGFIHPVVIPWKDGAERLARLRNALFSGNPVGRELYRALQPYTVSIYDKSFYMALNAGALEEVADGIYALSAAHMNHYDERYGLVIGEDIGVADPKATIL